MAYTSGTAVASGLGGQHNLIAALKTFIEVTLGWTSMRYVETVTSSGTTREQIYKAPGLSGLEEIYVGFLGWRVVGSDLYTLWLNGFTGYVSGNTFATQPGRISADIQIPVWNNAIDYYFRGNGQHVSIWLKINNVWVGGYLGKYLPYATPSQYPYPLYIGGMYQGANIRYDNTGQVCFFKGNTTSGNMRFVDGNWRQPYTLPYAMANTLRNTKSTSTNTEITEPGYYDLYPIELTENTAGYVNVYGFLDGLYFISGFSNAIGNTVVIGGITYLVLSDFGRLGLKDFVAIALN